MTRQPTIVFGTILVASLSTFSSVWSQPQATICTDGNGRYQLALTSRLAAGNTMDLYEVVFDTCTGQVVSRHELKKDRYTSDR